MVWVCVKEIVPLKAGPRADNHFFLATEHFEFSGVSANIGRPGLVWSGLHSREISQNDVTRINMPGVWNTVIFVMNVLVSILIGFQFPDIMDNLGLYTR